jgi:hypothetical protein
MPEDFVVETDHNVVARTHFTMLRAQRGLARTLAIGGALIIAVALVAGFSLLIWPLLIGGVVLGSAACLESGRQYAGVRRRQAMWSNIPAESMRLSEAGLLCRFDVAPEPCFLPWPTVEAFDLQGERILTVRLALGVTETTPGVRGLGQRALRRWPLRFATASLRQSPEEIDQALSAYTGGRVRIRRTPTSAAPHR